MDIIVSASLLACDFSNLAFEIKRAEDAGVDWIHYDVLTGKLVRSRFVCVCLRRSRFYANEKAAGVSACGSFHT